MLPSIAAAPFRKTRFEGKSRLAKKWKPAQSQLGRFLSPDPLGLATANNVYSYPTNPISMVDPSGLDPVSDWRRSQPYVNRNHSAGSSYWNGDSNDDPYLRVPAFSTPKARKKPTAKKSVTPSGRTRCNGYQPPFGEPPWPRWSGGVGPPPLNAPSYYIPEPMQYAPRWPDYYAASGTFGEILAIHVTGTYAPSTGFYFGVSGGFGIWSFSGGPGWRFYGASGEKLDSTISGWGFNVGAGATGGLNWSISIPSGDGSLQGVATSPGFNLGVGYTVRIWPWR